MYRYFFATLTSIHGEIFSLPLFPLKFLVLKRTLEVTAGRAETQLWVGPFPGEKIRRDLLG
jgi:hypothetical protein